MASVVWCCGLIRRKEVSFYRSTVAFSALTLLVWCQEGHPARKKHGGMVEVGTG